MNCKELNYFCSSFNLNVFDSKRTTQSHSFWTQATLIVLHVFDSLKRTDTLESLVQELGYSDCSDSV